MNNKQKIKLLKPYWKKYINLYYKYIKKLNKIEERMNKKIKKYKLPELEFFSVDGEIVGIGASFFADRDKFKLIQSDEFENE